MYDNQNSQLALILRLVGECRRHLLLIIAFAAIMTAGAYAVSTQLPPSYTATSVVWMGERDAVVITSDSAWDTVSPRPMNMAEGNAMAAMLTSIPVLRRVAIDLHLYDDPDVLDSQLSIFVSRLKERLGLGDKGAVFGSATANAAVHPSIDADSAALAVGTSEASPAEAPKLADGSDNLLSTTPGASGSAAGLTADEEEYVRIAVAKLSDGLDVSFDPRAEIAVIQYESTNPEVAADVVNALPEAFAAERRARLRSDSENAIAWLSTRVSVLRDDVTTAERELEQFKARNGLSGDDTNTSTSRRLESYIAAIDTARSDVIKADTRLLQAEAALTASTVDTELFASAAMTQLEDMRVAELSRRRELETRVGPGHAALVAVDKKLLAIERDMEQERTRLMVEVRADATRAELALAAAQTRYEDAQLSLVDEAQQTAGTISALNELNRALDSRRALYNTMNERLHEARQVAELESDGINLIEPALVPAASSGIKPPMIVAAAGIGSLFFGLTFVAGLSLIDRRIIHPDQILALGFDRIVSAPKVDQPTTVSPLKSQGQKVKREQYQAQLLFDEAIRRILSQSVFDGFGQKRVVLVTSGSKQEGKTTVARRLASFAAASGCSAVLVEADLRRPGNYSHKLGESNGGLARFLEAGEGSNLENVLVCDRRTGMHVIPTTDTVQHSTELLASPAMSQLLETLSERYDVVVIDTPPVGLTPDPEVLLKYADDIVFVVKHRASLIDRTKRATEFLKRAGDRKTIMMVNMTDMAFFDDYYGAGDHVYEFSSRKRWSRKAATSLLKNRLYRVRPRSAQHSDNTVQTYEVQKPSQH